MKNSVFADSGKATSNGSNPKQVVRSLLPTIVINAILPFIIYVIMKNLLHQSDFLSLVATGIPPTLASLISIVRNRRIDFIAGVVLLGIVVGLLVTLVSHDAKLLLVRESFFTMAFGLAFLVSLLFPKPLIYYATRTVLAGNDPEQVQRYEARWQDTAFRIAIRTQTTIWGVGLLLEATVRFWLVFTLSIAQFLVISPFVLWGILALTFIASRLYMERWKKVK
jgi:intracellular septation protein A